MIESISAWGGKTSLSISAGMPALAHRGGAPAHFATTPIEGVAQLEASKFDLIAVSSIGPAVLDAAALTLIIARLAPRVSCVDTRARALPFAELSPPQYSRARPAA